MEQRLGQALQPQSDSVYVLVTGANSGLGFAICCRLMDEFLASRSQSAKLYLIYTTRDLKKSDDTLRRLRKHLQNTMNKADAKQPGISKLLEPRIQFQPELVDLTSLQAVHTLAQKLLTSLPRLDRIILNAGIGGWAGLSWPLAAWTVLTDFPHSVTWPTFKIGQVGLRTKLQLQRARHDGDGTSSSGALLGEKNSSTIEEEEPVLGQVFCANVFGHYLLTHFLCPVLSQSSDGGRVIWISSIETTDTCLQLPDIQGLESAIAYEGSKRLTDILVLTSRLPSTARWTKPFLSSPPRLRSGAATSPGSSTSLDPTDASARQTSTPKLFVSHPGVTATSIVPLHPILNFFMILAFHLARLVGSPWHTVDAYVGACSAVWLALTPQHTLDTLEQRDGPGKWGSAVDRRGNVRAQRTEVDGWGFGGVVGDAKKFSGRFEYAGARKGRRRGAKDVTAETRAEFEQLGRSCWQEMESLRVDWEKRLGVDAIPSPDLKTVAS